MINLKQLPYPNTGPASVAIRIHVRRSALEKRRCGIGYVDQRLLSAVPYERLGNLDFNGFRDFQGVFKFNAQISYGAAHLGMTQQKLNSTQVARLPLDLGDLCPSH